jgi:Family of unknown function (DUF5681)
MRASIVAHNGRVRPSAGVDTDKLALAYCPIDNTKIAIMFVFHGAPGNAEGPASATERGGAMTDISLQKTAKTAGRTRGRPFAKGQSGNPGGWPRGSTNRATRAAELLLDGEAAALTRKAVELALAGDPAALRLCLDRTVAPRRERSVELALPPIRSAADILGAIEVVSGAVGRGAITPGEGVQFPR